MQMIAAVDRAWAIGRGTDLLISIQSDQRRFRQLTSGCTVVYGRKTLESFPGGKPLPQRRNIILSRTLQDGEGYVTVRSYSELARLLAEEKSEPWLIGGASLYEKLEPFCRAAEITLIDHEFAGAEHYFPNLDKLPEWSVTRRSADFLEAGHLLSFSYLRYERIPVRPLAEIAGLDQAGK